MASTKQLLSDTGDTIKEIAKSTLHLASLAVPWTVKVTNGLVGTSRSLIGVAKDPDLDKTAKEMRKTAKEMRKTAKEMSQKGSKAVSRMAKEIESRRPGHGPTKAQRVRKYGLIGAGVAAGVALVLYVPRKVMDRFRVEEDEPYTNHDVVPTPAQAAGGEDPSSPPSNTSVEHAIPPQDQAAPASDGRRTRSA